MPAPATITPPAAAVDRDNPWPGLASFTEDSRGFFFGREKETEELVRLVRRQTLTVLFSQSGLGKSSLLQAGLFPLLRETDFLPLYLRLDHNPASFPLAEQVKAALVHAFKTASADAPAPRGDESLWEYFHRKDIDIWSAKNRLLTPVLAFDQFEEIFTLGRASEAARERSLGFLDELSCLVENRAPAAVQKKLDAGELDPARFNFTKPSCQVILSLREDFLPDLEGLKQQMPALVHNRLRLKRLSGTQALEIVTKPAPHLLADGVAERIIEFVAGARGGSAERLAELDVEPPLLSVICRELNDRRRALGQTQITADLVSGNRREILTDFYERSVADLPEAMQAFVEDRLLTKSGFRDNLALETALETPGVTRPLLDTLVSRRLVRIEERLGVQRVELTHDVLAEVIRASRDARQQRLALEEARAREQRVLAAATQRTRKLRWLVGGLTTVVVALCALGIYGLRARRIETQRSSRVDIGIASRFLEENKTTEGLAYLLRAARKDPHNPVVAPRLASILTSRNFLLPEGGPIELGSRVLVNRFSAEGKSLLVICEDGTLALIDTATGAVTRNKLSLPPVGVVVMSTAISIRSRDNVVRVIDRATGRITHEIPFDKRIVQMRGTGFAGASTVVLDADNSLLVVRLEDQSLHLVETTTGVSRALAMKADSNLFDVTLDGRWMVMFDENTAKIWDTTRGILTKTLAIPDLSTLRLTPDGSRLITLARSNVPDTGNPIALQIWSFPSAEPMTPPIDLGHSVAGQLTGLAISADGRFVATALPQGAQIFDAVTGAKVSPFLAVGPGGFQFLPSGNRFTNFSAAGLEIRDTVTGQPVTPSLPHGGALRGRVYNRDGTLMLTNASDGYARLWDLTTGELVAEPTLQQAIDFSASLSPDGTQIAIGTMQGTVYRLRVGRGVAQPLELPRSSPVMPAPFVAEGSARLLWLKADRAKVIDAASGREVEGGFAYPEPINGIWTGLGVQGEFIRADQRAMVVRTVAGKWCAWHLGPGGVTQSVPLENAPASPAVWIRFSPGADLVAMIELADRRTIRVWNMRTGKMAGAPIVTDASIFQLNLTFPVSFSPDGQRLVTGDNFGNAKVWAMSTGKFLFQLSPLRDSTIRCAVFSPDGSRIVTTNLWGEAQLWDAATGKPASPILYHAAAIANIAFSRDGRQLVTFSGDRTARAWATGDGAAIGEPMFHNGGIRDGSVDFDGRRLITMMGTGGGSAGMARLWDLRSTQPLTEPMNHPGVRGVRAAFSPDGRFVQTETVDNRFWLWSVPPLLPEGATTPEWLLDLATICASKTVNAEGQFIDASAAVAKIDEVRRTLAALPADAPYSEWGRWFLADRATRSIAPGFTITPADADKLSKKLLAERPAGPAAAAPTANPPAAAAEPATP